MINRHSVAELFRANALEKAGEEWRSEWAVALFYRPLGIVLAAAAMRLSIGATAVTLTTLAIALSLPAFAWFGGPPAYLAVGLLGLAGVTLDCVDGTIARATGTVSRLGHYLDFATDVIFRIALYAAAGLIAEGRHETPAGLVGWDFALAILAAAIAVTARLCRVYADHIAPPGPDSSKSAGDRSGFVFSAISGVDHLLPLFILLAGARDAMGWVILWLLFYSALDFASTQIAVLRRL